jgi:catechol 2,3-dioxygenase-like lactoylglutathione lyase family enzyme
MGDAPYDRSAEDLGNIVALEHVNVRVPDQAPATSFYVSGLGLTRDPYMMTGTDNMWVNVGRSQFHLPTGAPQRLRGRVGLVLPDRAGLLRRLDRVTPLLEGTRFAFAEHNDFVEATCPWGNTVRCHAPSDGVQLGMAYVEFDVPAGAAAGIAAFYREVFGAQAEASGGAARVSVGRGQALVFRETEGGLPDYDGHHVQIYIAHFSRPHRELQARGLITQESSRHQYRFQAIVDPQSGASLFEIEHEVRSLTHPLYARPLVNRNPEQTQRAYVPGRDAWVPEGSG